MAQSREQVKFQPILRPKLHQLLQEAIHDYILRNSLRPGDPLPSEGELARQLGAGRNSIREAVKALESIGLIEVRRGSGLFLRESFLEPLVENLPYGLLFDLEELEELLEVRRVLETGMISQAIAAMTDERIAELEQVLSAIARKAALPSEFPEEDRAFHRLLHQNVGNRVLLKILDAFWLTFHKAVEYADLGGSEPLSTYLDHASILEAVRKHDIVAAREALDRHYAGIQVRLARLRLKGVPP